MRILPMCLMPVLLAVSAANAALPLQTVRVALPAQLHHAGKKINLLPKRKLDAGDRISTGKNGRAGLSLDNAGQLVLGDESELYIHSAEAPGGSAGALARLALMRGSLRLDSTARPNLPPQDMRLNVGTLRLRVLGAEVWANVEPGLSQTVCLLQGTVEIVSDAGDETLSAPGDCFRFSASNVRMRLKSDSDATLARKLARTAFAGERPPGTPPVTVAVPQTQQQIPVPLEPALPPEQPPILPEPPPLPEQTPELAALPPPVADPAPALVMTPESAPPIEPALSPAAATPAMPTAVEWTVVVASLKTAAAAHGRATQLIGQGLPAHVHESAAAGSYRVCIGRFSSRDNARAYGAQLRGKQKLQNWVTTLN